MRHAFFCSILYCNKKLKLIKAKPHKNTTQETQCYNFHVPVPEFLYGILYPSEFFLQATEISPG